MERAELVAHALDFLVRLTDEDVPLDEALNALSAVRNNFSQVPSWAVPSLIAARGDRNLGTPPGAHLSKNCPTRRRAST